MWQHWTDTREITLNDGRIWYLDFAFTRKRWDVSMQSDEDEVEQLQERLSDADFEIRISSSPPSLFWEMTVSILTLLGWRGIGIERCAGFFGLGLLRVYVLCDIVEVYRLGVRSLWRSDVKQTSRYVDASAELDNRFISVEVERVILHMESLPLLLIRTGDDARRESTLPSRTRSY